MILITAAIAISVIRTVSAGEALTWQDCLREAKKNNPELISSGEGIQQQRSSRTETASSLFPQIDASLSASTSGSSTTNSVTDVTTKSTSDSYSYGVSVSQLVFDGFKTMSDVRAASENVLAAEQSYRFTSSEVRLALRNAFVNLLKAQELIRVAEDIVKIRKDSLMLITLRYESGLEHKGALLTADANLLEANFELAQAKRNVEFSERQLTKELGRAEFRPLSVTGDFAVRDQAKEKPDFETMVQTHPSVLQAAFKKNSASFGVRSAFGNFAPKLSGTAGASKQSPWWPPNNEQWDMGLSVNMPLFEGGLKFAQLSRAQSVYRQAEADARTARDTAIVNLAQAWAGLQDALETVDVRYKTLLASEERSKIAEAQYSTGFINFDNWIIIENELVTDKKAYLEAQANALLAEAGWIQAKGETLEYAS